MKKITQLLSMLLIALALTSGKHQTTIFVIGDSTAAEKDKYKTDPERGWGMVLQGFFDEDIRVENHARNGRSSKSFINEGRWQKVLDNMKPGDYVLIQFGHNDEKSGETRHTDPGTTFDYNMERFVNETRAKGAYPVLLNAVVRRCFWTNAPKNDDDEKLRNTTYDGQERITSDTLIDTHGLYLLSPLNVAKELNVPFVDANKITRELEQSMGPIESRKLHMWFRPGEEPSVPEGRQDNTHYNIYGANLVASLLIDEIARQVPALKKYVRHYDSSVASNGMGLYFSPQEAVDKAPFHKKTTILINEGTWKKPSVPKGKKIKFVRRKGARWE